MHNKSFTADNQATIVGGRNIGDEYLGAGEGLLFADLDVLAVGPVVSDVSRQFDRYWASRSAYPADRILAAAGPGKIDEIRSEAARIARNPAARRYIEAIRTSAGFAELTARGLKLEWANTRLVSDHPAKTHPAAGEEDTLLPGVDLGTVRPRPGSAAKGDDSVLPSLALRGGQALRLLDCG